MPKNAIVIGSGFAGLAASSFMAKAGWGVTVLEKHTTPGGRARRLKENGFTFDMLINTICHCFERSKN